MSLLRKSKAPIPRQPQYTIFCLEPGTYILRRVCRPAVTKSCYLSASSPVRHQSVAILVATRKHVLDIGSLPTIFAPKSRGSSLTDPPHHSGRLTARPLFLAPAHDVVSCAAFLVAHRGPSKRLPQVRFDEPRRCHSFCWTKLRGFFVRT